MAVLSVTPAVAPSLDQTTNAQMSPVTSAHAADVLPVRRT